MQKHQKNTLFCDDFEGWRFHCSRTKLSKIDKKVKSKQGCTWRQVFDRSLVDLGTILGRNLEEKSVQECIGVKTKKIAFWKAQCAPDGRGLAECAGSREDRGGGQELESPI